MDISEMDKAEVLRLLYNNAKVQGMGLLWFKAEDMTHDEAAALLNGGQIYFDYVKGRVMKINLKGNELDTRLYNRDNGPDAAEKVLRVLVRPDVRRITLE